MTKRLINPAGLYDPGRYYTHAVAAHGGTTVFVAGQVALTPARELVGPGDKTAQARQAFVNLRTALTAAGAAPSDVVKITVYIVDYRPADLAALEAGLAECFGAGHGFASTVVGVQALALDGLLIEVEAVAVIG